MYQETSHLKYFILLYSEDIFIDVPFDREKNKKEHWSNNTLIL